MATSQPAMIVRPWDTVSAAHAATGTIAIGLGITIFLMRKGTFVHRMAGRVWTGAMVAASLASYCIREETGTFNWRHGLTSATLYCACAGFYHIKNKNIKAHKTYMALAFLGASVAGLAAVLSPGKRVNVALFGLPAGMQTIQDAKDL